MIAGPLSAAQQRVWLADRLAGATAAYIIPFGIRLRGRLDVSVLRRALEALLVLHPMLCLCIRDKEGEPEQYFVPFCRVELPVIDLSGSRARDREARAWAIAESEVRLPFALEGGPLHRLSLIRLTETDHLLVWPIHHLACDGASIRQLLCDLGSEYRALAAGCREHRRPGKPSFIDLAVDERLPEQEEIMRAHLAYWVKRLQGAPQLLTFPGDRPRPLHPTFSGFTAHAVLPHAMVRKVEEVARIARVSPFAVYSAAYHAWLSRYSGEEDILVGFTSTGRHRRASLGMVGLFANLLVQRGDLGGTPTGHELMEQLQADVASALQHDRVRFEMIVRELGASASNAHPIFQALLDYYGSPLEEVSLSDHLSGELLLFDTGTSRFDLELSLRPCARTGEVGLALKCNSDLFDDSTVTRMGSHFVQLLRGLLATPDSPVSALPILTENEQRAMIALAAGPRAALPRASVQQMIVGMCRTVPDRCAVRSGGRSYSYRELDRRSGAIASYLSERNVSAGTIVGVAAHRGFEMVAGLLGVLRSGAAFLPLDPDYPAERLRHMLRETEAGLVLATRSAAGALGHRNVALLEEIDDAVPDERYDHDLRSDGLESPAYVLYTSGSTGLPKGAANTRRGLLNRLTWMQDTYRLEAADAVLHKTPIGFDVFIWEILWPLMAGARLVIAPVGAHRHPHELSTTIAHEGVTVVHFVPSMLRIFLEEQGFASCDRLRLIISSGEALTRALADDVMKSTTAALHNLYGPTEAAIDVTAFDCRSAFRGAAVPLGRPIANTELYVLDRQMSPVPPGVTGELFIGGVQVAHGYVGRPRETTERFVPNPFGEPGARLYRTGDLGRMSAEGQLEFIGRADAQIKLQGNRIEPGEIEAVITEVPGVSNSVVCLDTRAHPPRLVAFVEDRSGSVSADGVRTALAARLPPSMVPAVFVMIAALPKLPNGKIDRGHLPWAAGALPPRAGGTPPNSVNERLLAEAWGQTLGIEAANIDVNQPFFVVGGDSIRSIELVVQARRRKLDIRVEEVFEFRTIRALAQRARPLRTRQKELDDQPSRGTALQPREPEHVEEPLPLPSLFASLVEASSRRADYRIYVTSIRVAAPWDAHALAQACALLADRHPFLRSAVVVRSGERRLHFHPDVVPDVRTTDWRSMGVAEREEHLTAWLEEERAACFSWGRPPLWRLNCHRLNDDQFQLTLSEPFLDGWSATLALSELLDLYEDLLAGQAVSTVPGDSDRSYRTFLQQENLALKSEVARDFWRDRLKSLPRTRLLDVFGHGDTRHTREEVILPGSSFTPLKRLASEVGVGLKSILLTLHLRVLAALSGQAEVSSGIMTNARPETEEGARSLGLFLNVLPIQAAFGQQTWRQAVQEVFAAEAKLMKYRAYPFQQMLIDQATDSPTDALFNFTHFHPYRSRMTSGMVRIIATRAFDQTYFPLTAQFRQDPVQGEVHLALEFGPGHGGAAARQSISDCYRDFIADLVASPDARCARPRHKDWTRPAGPAAKPACLHVRFEQQVASTPQAKALVTASQACTYEELQRRVRSLSAGLGQIGHNRRIGVCLPRSIDAIASVLAILRRGCIYVPLDPVLPPARLRMLHDLAGCDLTVVDERTSEAFEGRPTFYVSHSDSFENSEPSAAPPAADPASAAYMIFTSGSTGTPKAAVVPHQTVMNRLSWQWRELPYDRQETACMRSSIGFVDSIAEMFSGLLAGIPTFIVDDSVASEPRGLVQALAGAGVSRVTLTPSLLAELLRLDLDLGACLAHLRYWILSGEPLAADLARALLQRTPQATVINLYGSTEVAGDVTWHRVGTSETGSAVPIGRAIDGVSAVVVDGVGDTAHTDVVGELLIGGAAASGHYADDPALTDARFIPDPWATPDGRLFRTGDLARRDREGVLWYAGRRDREIKVRGVRVNPAEVEAVLRRQPGILDAVVELRKIFESERRLVAYVRLESGWVDKRDQLALSARLRRAVLAQMHSAAAPDLYCTIEQWPLLATGKIDRAALPLPPDRSAPDLPETDVERWLATLWARCLDTTLVGRHDDFFALGGQSLRAMLLAARVKESRGVAISLSEIFDHPILSDQAKLIAQKMQI